MKKLVNIIKKGVTYQLGAVSTEEVSQIKSDIQDLKDQVAAIDTTIYRFVETLPTANIEADKIYVVVNSKSTDQENTYIEYSYINNKWEKIGEFKANTDLSDYYTKSDVDEALSNSDKTWFGKQADYDALTSKDNTVAYYVYEEVTEDNQEQS